MLKDLAKGISRFTSFWKVLFWINALGWILALIAGLTGLMALWWFAIWIIPLSAVLFAKATLNYFNGVNDDE